MRASRDRTEHRVAVSAIYNANSTTNIVVDVQGYFTAAGQGGAVFTPGAGRAYDTRTGSRTPLGNNETRSIQIAGVAGVPVMGSGINAVVLTLTALKSTAGAGNATVWADGTTRPNTTSINFDETTIRTSTITVPLGANGKVSLNNVADATNYVIDVQGWYTNPQAPSISCPSPYATGSWVAAKPSSLTCTVTVAPADSSSNVVSVLSDASYTEFARSDSAAVTKSVSVSPDAGLHTITAVSTAPDGSDITTSYEFGLSYWSTTPIKPLLADGSTVSTTSLLSVASDGDLIPSDASIRYVIASTDGSVAAESGPVVGAWHVPAGALTAEQSYTWTATVTAPAAGATTASTVTSASWAFTVNSDVADDYAGAPTMTETSTETGTDTINPNDVQSPTITSGGSSTAASGGGVSSPSSVQVKAAKSTSKLLQASATKKVTGGRGSFRVSFSSVASINSKVTYANVDGESANYFTGKKPSKVTLTDYVNGSGIDLSASIGDGGPSVTIANSGKTIKWGSSTTKNKYVEHDWDRFSYSATYIQSITESATGTVTFGSSSWSTRAG